MLCPILMAVTHIQILHVLHVVYPLTKARPTTSSSSNFVAEDTSLM